ncbi:MAG TPA: HlyC/CorC family transporter [Steroidobacteraceae bacterium]|nr:HlyC/CorC family transporter [Steroidobacteraceae bacterium]
MSDVSTGSLLLIVLLMIVVSAFFASTETALMSLNRYRLRHKAQSGNRSAKLAEHLLSQPDRLIGVILLGNTFANFAAASLVGTVGYKLYGEPGFAIATLIASIIMFIVGDLAPKTYGALYPERLALPATWVYVVLNKILYPVIWCANLASNSLLRLIGVSARQSSSHSLSSDELRTLVAEANTIIPSRHQRMLVSILDLEKIHVEDIMIPRNDIAAINANDEWDDILEQLRTSPHTRLPVYEDSLDNVIGMLHLKSVAQALAHGDLDKEKLVTLAKSREPFFIPEGTSLNTQLLNFQRNRRRIALVVSEYGDVQGIVTLEDLLEEIVGEFTTDPAALHREIHDEKDGNYVVAGSISIRTLNRTLGWTLPTDGPRTLNGLILEYLETIPEPGTALRLGNYAVEIMQIADNTVKTARIRVSNDTTITKKS